jgi:glycosyltransferase involved in cell wall biosynthesis
MSNGSKQGDKVSLKYLNNEFDKFWQKIENGENFALMRNGDGERAIATGRSVTAQEGWKSPEFVSKLGNDLLKSFEIIDDNIFCAISCPCCDSSAYYWYITRVINKKNITFANLWVNINHTKFINKFGSLKRDAILIANYAAKGHKIGNLNILKHYEISDDCISFWEQDAPAMLSAIKKDFGTRTNLLYVVSAGPMSGPMIADLYNHNQQNCYIDFGSAIDIYYRKNFTRPYMRRGTVYAERNCWMHDPMTENFDVSVVLTLYKRPESLEIQLQAIENQTLKPKEILLYQDGTGDTIKIPDHLKERFSLIEINPHNVGVWGRFDFAMRKASCKYACVFDDDTIPGARWLENCHAEMLKQEGLYGTIGIVLEKPELYPNINKGSHFRVGWQGNLSCTAEVDFVGHSWFFKREWLPCLFNAPSDIKKYKLVGEDMSFSYQLLKEGVKTYVPPHPRTKKELHGSIKKYAHNLGISKDAISLNPANIGMMTEAITILLKNNWNLLIFRNRNHVKRIKKQVWWQNSKLVNFIIRCKMFVKKRILKRA